MTYRILVEKRVQKETRGIPQLERKKIDKAILSLASNPRPHGCKKLTEKEGYRIRIGDYRVLYMIDDDNKVIIIYRIKSRSEKTYK
ncbi:MAG: type II toxin-antitoxin system RelE/ParE family toxin [Nitrospiria bacterium]